MNKRFKWLAVALLIVQTTPSKARLDLAGLSFVGGLVGIGIVMARESLIDHYEAAALREQKAYKDALLYKEALQDDRQRLAGFHQYPDMMPEYNAAIVRAHSKFNLVNMFSAYTYGALVAGTIAFVQRALEKKYLSYTFI